MSISLKAIPLRQLQRSKINVRKTDKTADIEQLAASIEAHGLLENLIVSPLDKTNGADAIYDVIAGGRRLAALKLLAKRKKIESDFAVPCQVRKPNGSNLTELSLAENFAHTALHPADQFEAFAKLQREGLPAEDIAARFGVSAKLVQQRLKLGAVSPKLMAEYRKDAMTLEQLMAFAISDDHKAQEEVWFAGYSGMPAQEIRRRLTQSQVTGRDRRARFIGAKAYEEAGGTIVRDLFDEADEGYFGDSQLLDRLVLARLEIEADVLRAEGWKWVEVMVEADYSYLSRFGRAATVETPLSAKDQKRLERLSERYDVLVADLEEEEDPKKVAELDQVSADMEALHAKCLDWAPGGKDRAGAILSLDADGDLDIHRGLIRPEDSRGESASEQRPGKSPKVDSKDAYPESLVADLSAHRTAALRECLAARPEDALTALLHTLVQRIFFDGYQPGIVGIAATMPTLERYSKSVGESIAAKAFLERHEQWQAQFAGESDLTQTIARLDPSQRLALLAHCVGATLDGVWRRSENGDRLSDADRLAAVVGLDMADWWRPTAANFFGALTKEQIVRTVTEGCSPAEGRRLLGLKKGEMAEHAERLLKDGRWLPEGLRGVCISPDTQPTES